MKITDLQEETEDLDWFAVDPTGAIAHFTTGGQGFLPASVKESMEDLITLKTFFQKEAGCNGKAIVTPDLEERVKVHFLLGIDYFIKSYSEMAEKGLFSFDYITGSQRPTGYFLVAKPTCPLGVKELPSDIRNIIESTRLVVHLSEATEINENDVT